MKLPEYPPLRGQVDALVVHCKRRNPHVHVNRSLVFRVGTVDYEPTTGAICVRDWGVACDSLVSWETE